jgi:hypothetical protein
MKKLTMYPPAKSILDLEELVWVPHNDEDTSYDTTMQPTLTIDYALTLKEPTRDRMILNFMKNMYPSIIQNRDHTE